MGPRMRVLTNRVTFIVDERQESGRYDVVAMGSVDRYGEISLDTPAPHGADTVREYRERQDERRADYAEALTENELAERRSTGPGDSELFATAKFRRMLTPALDALPNGWTPWVP